MKPLATGLLLALLLAGCASQKQRETAALPNQAAYDARAAAWQGITAWTLTARLGLNDGDQGGSGRLDWRVDGAESSLSFRGTLGRGSWRLELDGEGAVLYLADGEVIRDDSVSELVRRESGLEIPVEALHWWVRGLAQPGGGQALALDGEGLPVTLRQGGWLIRYEKFMEEGGLTMPRKLEATRDHYSVKLSVSRWRLGSAQNDV